MATEDSKAAIKAYQKAYRAAHAEKHRAYMVVYYAANKAKLNAQAAERYRANPDSYKERARIWEIEHPERNRELAAQYRSANREKIKEISQIDWQRHNAKRRATKAAYRAAFPELGAHYVRLRQTRKQQATPLWADLEVIKDFYKEASNLSKHTGTKWHVDHQIPLKHPLVCGLHNEFNLRVITCDENQSKGNRFEVS